jgi:hypothetical protein
MITLLLLAISIVVIYGSLFLWARNEYLKMTGSPKQRPVLSKEADEALEKKYLKQLWN